MTRDELMAVIKDQLLSIAPEVDAEAIDPAADLREAVDIDSMDFLNFVTALHQRLQVDIPDADAPKLLSLNGALEYLSAKLGV